MVKVLCMDRDTGHLFARGTVRRGRENDGKGDGLDKMSSVVSVSEQKDCYDRETHAEYCSRNVLKFDVQYAEDFRNRTTRRLVQ